MFSKVLQVYYGKLHYHPANYRMQFSVCQCSWADLVYV
jgi:hypothetical protein